MVYILVYSLVSITSTLNHKLHYIEDTYTCTSLCEMVTYYTQFSCYFLYLKMDIQIFGLISKCLGKILSSCESLGECPW